MNSDPTELGILFTLVLLGFVGIGYKYRTSNSEQFHSMDRKAGTIRTAASLFTVVGAPHFAIFTSLVYIFGPEVVSFYIGTLLGFSFLFLITPRIRRYLPDDVHSFPDIAAASIGRFPALLLTLIALSYMIGVTVAQVIVGGMLITDVSGVPFWYASTIIIVAVAGYLLWGGYRTLLFTDLIQGAILFLFTFLLLLYLWEGAVDIGISNALSANNFDITSFSSSLTVMLFIGGMVATAGSPEIWQRVLNSGSDRRARASIAISAVLMALWGCFIIFIAIFIQAILPEAAPHNAFSEFVTTQLPEWLVGGVVLLLLVALISTSDTEVFASAVVLQKEWMRYRKGEQKPLNLKNSRKLITAISLVVLAITIFLGKDVVEVFNALINFAYIFTPIGFAMAWGRGGKTRQQKNIIYSVAIILAVIAFICVGVSANSYFSKWAIVIILTASIPMAFNGKKTV